jgi:predicted deacetylase
MPTDINVRETFCVMLHDVAPCFASEVDQFAETLSPLVGTTMAAAVVPCWGGTPLTDDDRPFLDRVRANYGNIQLHGFEHFRPKGAGLVSLFASGKDEMNGLSPEATDRCLAEGQEILKRWMGRAARGFIAPTYQIGNASPQRLARVGIHYTVGYRQVVTSDGRVLPISTWIWDVSPIRLLCRAGYRLGNLQYRLRSGALPCVTLHPLDIRRGFLPQIVRTIERLLRDGRKPILLEDHGYGDVPEAGPD